MRQRLRFFAFFAPGHCDHSKVDLSRHIWPGTLPRTSCPVALCQPAPGDALLRHRRGRAGFGAGGYLWHRWLLHGRLLGGSLVFGLPPTLKRRRAAISVGGSFPGSARTKYKPYRRQSSDGTRHRRTDCVRQADNRHWVPAKVPAPTRDVLQIFQEGMPACRPRQLQNQSEHLVLALEIAGHRRKTALLQSKEKAGAAAKGPASGEQAESLQRYASPNLRPSNPRAFPGSRSRGNSRMPAIPRPLGISSFSIGNRMAPPTMWISLKKRKRSGTYPRRKLERRVPSQTLRHRLLSHFRLWYACLFKRPAT